jgi:hypothetical protein
VKKKDREARAHLTQNGRKKVLLEEVSCLQISMKMTYVNYVIIGLITPNPHSICSETHIIASAPLGAPPALIDIKAANCVPVQY